MLYWFRYTTKHAFDGLISRWDTAEETISKHEDMLVETSKLQSKAKKDGGWGRRTEQNIQGLWDNYKRCNIHVAGLQEGEKRKE